MSGFSTFWVAHETGFTATANQIRVQQMAILTRRSPVIFVAVAANAVLTAAVAGPAHQPQFAMLWAGLLCVLSVAGLLRWYFRRKPVTPDYVSNRGPRRLAIAATLHGLLWGTGCAVIFPVTAGSEQVFVGIVEAGMAAAGATMLATLPAASIGYTLGCLIPFIIRLALHDDALNWSLAAMTIMFMLVLLITARSFYVSFVDGVRGRVATEKLLTDLSGARQDLLDAIASSTEGFALFDSAGKLVVANDRFAELLRLESDITRVGLTYAELLQRAGRGSLDQAWRDEQVRRHLACDGRSVVSLPDGRWLGIGHRRAGQGGVVTTLIDLTSFKQNEIELLRATAEAEDASRSKSEFLAMMSHELRTPLNAILGFAEIFMSEMFGPHTDRRYKTYAHDIHEGGQHLLQVINNILDLSKVEAGRFELDIDSCSLPDLANSVIRLMQARSDEAGLKLILDADTDLPLLLGDQRVIRQMMLNLIGNAIRFTNTGGMITVRLTTDAAGAQLLTVSDTGIGIAAADIPRVLEPFGQADAGLARRQDGTGLGLPLVQSFIALHDGTVDLSSEPGVGTVVTLRFPPERNVDPAAGSSESTEQAMEFGGP
ncbi:MAG: ATP-binding protein [Minwuia sp.]|nr:ATP-binding protein [Minwuia sp.]